jgi:hypothetical protein
LIGKAFEPSKNYLPFAGPSCQHRGEQLGDPSVERGVIRSKCDVSDPNVCLPTIDGEKNLFIIFPDTPTDSAEDASNILLPSPPDDALVHASNLSAPSVDIRPSMETTMAIHLSNLIHPNKMTTTSSHHRMSSTRDHHMTRLRSRLMLTRTTRMWQTTNPSSIRTRTLNSSSKKGTNHLFHSTQLRKRHWKTRVQQHTTQESREINQKDDTDCQPGEVTLLSYQACVYVRYTCTTKRLWNWIDRTATPAGGTQN